jgi:hypothetical protein
MNERVEAYLKQHYCRDYFNSYGETIEDDHYFMYREEVNGLIELIVKECARVAALTECPYTDEVARQTYGHTWDMACVESAKEIRRYFGVE